MKSNVLMYFENKDTKEVVQLLLESKFNVKTFVAPNEQNALEVLRKNPTITLFLCNNTTSADKIISDIMSRGSKVVSIVCTHDHPKNIRLNARSKSVHYIPANGWVEHITTFASKYLKKKEALPYQDSSSEYWDSDFCRIQVEILPKVAPLNVDIYIKLSEQKLLKIFRKGDVFDLNDLDRYLNQKKIHFFYIKNSDVGEFLDHLALHIELVIKEGNVKLPIARSSAFQTAAGANEALQEIIKSIGPSSHVQELIESNVKLAIKSIGAHPKLRDYLNILSQDKTKYISEHSFMVGQIACVIASMMEWNSDATFTKLSLAAFFHDLVLRNPELAAIDNLTDLEKYKRQFTDAEIKSYKLHPIASAELIQMMKDIPQDVENIVLQHHERPDGTGFPRGLTNSQILPLSAIFIVAHDITQYAITHGKRYDLSSYIATAKEKFNQGNFRKTLRVLEEVEIKRTKK